MGEGIERMLMRTAPRQSTPAEYRRAEFTPAEAIATGSPTLIALILSLGLTAAGRLTRRR